MTERIAACRTCGAPIYWLRHVRTQKPAPIDATLSIEGNVDVDLDAGTYRTVPKHAEAHLNHWVTCTNPPERTMP